MKRINTFNHSIGDVDYELPKTPSTPYIVDDSNFLPMSEAIRQLGSGTGALKPENLLYDFKDGQDNGSPVPFHRQADVKDIAELSSHVSEMQSDISEKINKAQAFEKFKAETEARMHGSEATPSE